MPDPGQNDQLRLRMSRASPTRWRCVHTTLSASPEINRHRASDLAIARGLHENLRKQTGDILGVRHELFRSQHERDARLLRIAVLDGLRREDPGDAPSSSTLPPPASPGPWKSGPSTGLAASL